MYWMPPLPRHKPGGERESSLMGACDAPAPLFQMRVATASCSAFDARYAAGPVPPNSFQVAGMIW